MELMKSRAFIGDFVERHSILPELMAAEAWDLESGNIVFDSRLYDESTSTWLRTVTPPKRPLPSALEAYKAFSQILTISEDSVTGFVSVSISHLSPTIAAQWVEWLIEDVNSSLRAQDIDEANRATEYLKKQVASTTLADLQAVFFELIQAQTETVMLADVRPEYVFKTIDPAVVPEEKSGPNRQLICIAGVFLGGVLGVLVTWARNYLRRWINT